MFPGNLNPNRSLQRLSFISVSVFLVSCASSHFGKLTSSSDSQKELPKELQEKFKIEPAQTPAEAPVTAVVQSDQAAPIKKAEKKKKKAKVLQPAKGAFIYPVRRPEVDPIKIGEKLVYETTYFGAAAGYLTMEIDSFATINQRKVYHIVGHARTSKFFELFYKVDDTIESFLDYDGLFSHRFHLVLDESKQTRDSLELYDSEKRQSYYWNRWNHYQKGYSEVKEYHPMEAFPQDSISALYYMRSLPLALGKKFKVQVMTEGNAWDAEIEVLRTEMMDTPMGNVRCWVLRPETRFKGALKKTGESLFWVTDDDRKILIRVEAKVRIGSVVIQLKEASLGS